MKARFWREAAAQALLGLLFAAPLLAVLNHFVWKIGLWTIAVLMLLGFSAGLAIGGLRLRLYAQWALVAAAAALCGFLPLGAKPGLAAAVLAVAAIFAVYAGVRCALGYRWSLALCSIGLLSYFAVSIAVNVHGPLSYLSPLVHGCGLAALAVYLFTLNRRQLNHAELAGSNGRLAAGKVLLVNRIGTGALLVLIVLLADIRRLTEWLQAAFFRLAGWIGRLLRSGPSEPPPSEPPTAPAGFPGFFPEGEEKSPLPAALEQIMLVVAAALGIMVAALLLFVLATRVLKPAVRRWFAFMLSRQEDRGFVDETERLKRRGFGPLLIGTVGRMRAARPREPADQREKIRSLYREMLREAIKGGYAHEASRTPLETERELAETGISLSRPVAKLTALYNKVRYKEEEASEAEMRDLPKR